MDGEKRFKPLEVVQYLQGQKWKLKKSSLYLHIREGKLRADADGLFSEKAVLKYARNFLKRLDGSSARSGGAQARDEAEQRKLNAQARIAELKANIMEGKYILKNAFEQALAQRGALFKNDLIYFCHATAPAILDLLKVDQRRTPEMIDFLKDRIEDVLDRYCDKEGVYPLPLSDFGIEPEIMEDEDISENDTDSDND